MIWREVLSFIHKLQNHSDNRLSYANYNPTNQLFRSSLSSLLSSSPLLQETILEIRMQGHLAE